MPPLAAGLLSFLHTPPLFLSLLLSLTLLFSYPLPSKFSPSPSTVRLRHRTVMARPNKRKTYLRQVSKLGGRPSKRECRFQCASGQLGVFSNVQQSPALLSLLSERSQRSQRSQSLGLPVRGMVTVALISPWKMKYMDLTQWRMLVFTAGGRIAGGCPSSP